MVVLMNMKNYPKPTTVGMYTLFITLCIAHMSSLVSSIDVPWGCSKSPSLRTLELFKVQSNVDDQLVKRCPTKVVGSNHVLGKNPTSALLHILDYWTPDKCQPMLVNSYTGI